MSLAETCAVTPGHLPNVSAYRPSAATGLTKRWRVRNGTPRFIAEYGTTGGAVKGWETRRRGSPIEVVGSCPEKTAVAMLGKGAKPEDLAGIVGIDWDETAEVTVASSGTQYVHIKMATDDYTLLYQVKKTPEDGMVVTIADAYVDESRQGRGTMTRAMESLVASASRAGAKRIELIAERADSGERKAIGYKVWPRLGFDCAVEDLDNAKQVKWQFPNASRLSDLFKTADGRDWWDRHGVTMDAAFDLSEGSLSRRVFTEYLARKRHTVAESLSSQPVGDGRPVESDSDVDLALLDQIWDEIGRGERVNESRARWLRMNGCNRLVESWDSAEHPRGQPENAGQFVAKNAPPQVTVHGKASDVKIEGGKWQFRPSGKSFWRVASDETATEIERQLRQPEAPVSVRESDKPKGSARAEGKQPWSGGEITKGYVYNCPTSGLQVDPDRFQFKQNVDKEGVTDKLKSVKVWNPNFAGVISVWRDPEDGKTYVVNGHHRLELARRLGVDNLAIRYIDNDEAKTAVEARALGALTNIAEGQGTAIDAAKFLRDSKATPDEFAKRGVSLKGGLASEAMVLQGLSNRAFDDLVRGLLDKDVALAVGEHLKDHDLQDQLFRLLAKRDEDGKETSLKVVAEMSREMAETPRVEPAPGRKGGFLPGMEDIESAESLFVPRNELKSAIRMDMSREVRDFLAVASKRRAEAVAGAGNVLNLEENRRIADEAERILTVYDTLVNRKGPISDAINAGAGEYKAAKGKKEKTDVRQRTIQAVKQAVFAEAGVASSQRGAVGPDLRGGEGDFGGGPGVEAQGTAQDRRRQGVGESGMGPGSLWSRWQLLNGMPRFVAEAYDEDQPRDNRGRWAKGGYQRADKVHAPDLDEGSFDLTNDRQWDDVFYADPSPEGVKRLSAWLKEQRAKPPSFSGGPKLRMYHGTAAKHDIEGQGILKTSGKRRHSLQSRSGYVSLSLYPGMAKTFGQMAYPGQDIAVHAVDVPISQLVPDTDQLKNQRMFAERQVGNTLADSLAYGHGAQVKGDVPLWMLAGRVRVAESRTWRTMNGIPRFVVEAQASSNGLDLPTAIRLAAARTDTELTDAQRKSGRYAKGHVDVQGLNIAIENPKGSIRRGVSPEGVPWKSELAWDYGYIAKVGGRKTKGADGDAVDVFLGPHPEAELVFVVDQSDQHGGFDEHKVMVGFLTKQEAVDGYLANYQDGWQCGPVTALTMPQFRAWLEAGDVGPLRKWAAKRRMVESLGAISHNRVLESDPDWREEEHPRETGGQFAHKGEGAASPPKTVVS